MAALNGRSFFAAVVTILALILVLLVFLVYRRNQVELEDQSVRTTDPCTVAPNTPTNITITNPQGDLLIVEFLATINATSYVSQISTIDNFNDNQVEQESITFTNSSAFGNLNLGTTYYIRVKSRNACGDSDWSPHAEFSIAFNFPNLFVIADKNDPGIELCDNFNDVFVPAQTDQVSGKTFCSDTESFYRYDDVNKSLIQEGRGVFANPFCLTRFGSSDLFNTVCDGSAEQQWNYDSLTFSLCDANDPENGCVKLSGQNPSQKVATFGPKIALPQTEILINSV